ncbi:hypothetical protein DUNSADRAFT_7247 [Dunaliella salina]|uniref:Sec7/BIG1-like C-terminal domain-containing protein n=1 Tax=Dunaliella salina TaxID=3046 RepID=A0ABQ7GLR0_DUNSA|nr:hypothetical protein DUNSADRAFT_7247 [Dunaliella salina]|eukprot:KAF5835548.1 hypothetical protein DUNSADRAFT_7247 [Dunaliella salina]
MLPQMLQLLHSFVTRAHQSLASIGVAALIRLINLASPKMQEQAWQEVTQFLLQVVREVSPSATDIINPHRHHQQQLPPSSSHGASSPDSPFAHAAGERDSSISSTPHSSGTAANGDEQGPSSFVPGLKLSSSARMWRGFNLREGAGARRLAKFRCQAAVQLLLVQGCTDVYSKQYGYLPFVALSNILQATDPPLLRLEAEASHAYLSVLMHVLSYSKDTTDIKGRCGATPRMVRLCTSTLERFAQGRTPDNCSIVVGRTSFGVSVLMAAPPVEYAPFGTLVAAALRALSTFDEATFAAHLPTFFPLLTALMRTDHAPPEVLRILADLFAKRVGPVMGVAAAAATKEAASNAAVSQ